MASWMEICMNSAAWTTQCMVDYLLHCWLPCLLTIEINHDSSIWHHSSRSTPTWWKVDYSGHYPPWRKMWFILIRIESYSGYRFSLPACNSSASSTIWVRTYKMPNLSLWYPLYNCLTQRIHFISKDEWQWGNDNGIFNIHIMHPCHLEAARQI